ncbi:MAG TPA: urease accessory protein UreE [Candidatus Binatia bacterium]|nr:urease accessory protein UreE [Candidatus Binatia bacterium]
MAILELIEKVTSVAAAEDTVTLPYELRQKGRQRVRLDSGREAALVLPHGTVLDDGDCLRAADGTAVCVRAATEVVMTARSDDAHRLARACYHLGNRHVRVQLGPGWVRYQPDHVLDELVHGLGLAVTQEVARFEPERGAYHSHTGNHRRDAAHQSGADTPLKSPERRS